MIGSTVDSGEEVRAEPWPPRNPDARLLSPAEGYLDMPEAILEGNIGEAVERARRRLGEVSERLRSCREQVG